jgi:uncharacterized iron-regulated membrane protein
VLLKHWRFDKLSAWLYKMDWWILVFYPEQEAILASMIYFDSYMSKSTNTVVYFDWKTVIYIYVCGKCRTQFMLPELWNKLTCLSVLPVWISGCNRWSCKSSNWRTAQSQQNSQQFCNLFNNLLARKDINVILSRPKHG